MSSLSAGSQAIIRSRTQVLPSGPSIQAQLFARRLHNPRFALRHVPPKLTRTYSVDFLANP